MAFMGILFANILLGIWICILAAGFFSLLLCLIFLLLYYSGKKKGNPKKWKKVISIILGVIGGVCILPTICIFIQNLMPKRVNIETPQGEVKITQETANEFEDTIQANDVDAFLLMLERNPELYYYTTANGYNLLGASINYEAAAITEYLLKHGVDVDDTGNSEKSVNLVFDRAYSSANGLNKEILHLLLDYHADVNYTEEYRMPPIQHILEEITKDAAIAQDEIRLVERFIEEGADLSATNYMYGDNALEYFERIILEYELSDSQSDEVDNVRSLLMIKDM